MVIKLNYLVYEIDVYEEFYVNKDMFGFGEYQDDSRFFNVKNKNVVGKMTGETKGVVIAEFVGFSST